MLNWITTKITNHTAGLANDHAIDPHHRRQRRCHPLLRLRLRLRRAHQRIAADRPSTTTADRSSNAATAGSRKSPVEVSVSARRLSPSTRPLADAWRSPHSPGHQHPSDRSPAPRRPRERMAPITRPSLSESLSCRVGHTRPPGSRCRMLPAVRTLAIDEISFGGGRPWLGSSPLAWPLIFCYYTAKRSGRALRRANDAFDSLESVISVFVGGSARSSRSRRSPPRRPPGPDPGARPGRLPHHDGSQSVLDQHWPKAEPPTRSRRGRPRSRRSKQQGINARGLARAAHVAWSGRPHRSSKPSDSKRPGRAPALQCSGPTAVSTTPLLGRSPKLVKKLTRCLLVEDPQLPERPRA